MTAKIIDLQKERHKRVVARLRNQLARGEVKVVHSFPGDTDIVALAEATGKWFNEPGKPEKP